MNRLVSLLLVLLVTAAPARAVEEVSAVVGGKVRESLAAYEKDHVLYLSAKEAGGLYGAQVYWYSVSGRVQMSARGRSLQFVVGSDQARLPDGAVKLEAPVIVRTSQAYVPLSFFLTKEFSDWSAHETSFNPATRLLTVEKKGTVGPVRWFSYRDRTRLTLELGPGAVATANPRGLKGISVSIPFGVADASEEGEIADELVSSYSLRQNAKAVTLSVKLEKPGARWRVRELPNPRRFVLDIFSGEPGAETPAELRASAGPARAAPAQAPAASTATAAAAPASAPAGAAKAPEPRRRRRIVVDAGHGGKDSGAPGRRGTLEKDINLMAALDLARLLKEEELFEVKLTRDDDTFVPLAERSKQADDFGADLFVSLHCNASPNAKESGYEVYFLSEKASDPQAEKVADFENSVLALEGKKSADVHAELLLNELSKTENINAAAELAGLVAKGLQRRSTIENRGVKQAAFYVLRGTHAPAILLEMAYITNKKDESRLESRRARRQVVDGLYAGIIEYAKRRGWNGGPH